MASSQFNNYIVSPNPYFQIQYGSSNTGATPNTLLLPYPYSSSNYAIQLTYKVMPSGNQPLYVVSQTTSSFVFHGANNTDIYWTTFGQ